jgi:hypothetical protein
VIAWLLGLAGSVFLAWLALSESQMARRYRHTAKHLLRLNGSTCGWETQSNGCELLVVTCTECGAKRPVAHRAYCSGCGRSPK